jgi:hypothetical protein
MIPDKIKKLFQFIEYLSSNIENFNLNSDLIAELDLLFIEREKVRMKTTYLQKLKFDEVQETIESKFDLLQMRTAHPIKAKAKALKVCTFDNEPYYSFNGIESEIHKLKENFGEKDLNEIFKRKQQYIQYRNATHKTFLSMAIFFDEMDSIAKSLFDFFKETEHNEFEAFETKELKANDSIELVELLQKGHRKFTLPNSFLNHSNVQQQTKEEDVPTKVTKTKTDKISAPILGLFCSLINSIGIEKKDETENATVYCKRICSKFKLPYTDRVRQNYNVSENKKLIKGLTEKVLPLLDSKTRILIQEYLDSKQPPKQKLYV